jgi:DNA-binding PadR family transcriptional regulator
VTPTNAKRSPLALVLLALLFEAPMHPYRMQQLIKERGKDTVVNVSARNSVYQTIERLQRDGLLEAAETARDEGRPERTTYRITDAGRATVLAWLQDMLATPKPEYPEFPAALASIAMLTPDQVLTALRARTNSLTATLAGLRETAAAVAYLPPVVLVEDNYRVAMLTAEIDWLHRTIADLAAGTLTWSDESLRAFLEAHPR